MSRDGTLLMDSYRLANYAIQVPCYICEETNTFDAEWCRRCFAPMAIAHQASSTKVKPRLIGTVGASGVGKTVYLGMLMDMLSTRFGDLELLARGAFSISLQQATVSALTSCHFPEKTPNEPDRWNWVHCQVNDSRQKRPVELIMPDMAGEALMEEVNHPHTYEVVRSFLSKCSGVLVLVDAVQLREGRRDQDYFTMKLLTYLRELDDDPKHGWPNRPVAIVFSKADECEECFQDATAFARTHAGGLWRHCQDRFKKHRYFASGVAGACGIRDLGREQYERVPLRVEPRGIAEPFEWLVHRLRG
jgi:hypothetical protein